MKKLIYIFVLIFAFSSCSDYQKALKNEDLGVKFKMGTELFEAGKFGKANRIFAQIVPKYRGKPQAQKLMYMYSKTFYEMREYYNSNYQMERFVSAYPNSEKVEEIAFLAAKSYYQIPPVYSKEQKETIDAIDKLQDFINRFPNSEYLPEANTMVKELDFRLEKKAFEIAKQYHTLGPHNRDFEAAIKAFDNFILDFPGTSFREEAMFYRLDSAYKLAMNSVEWKMEERINNALAFYISFKNKFKESSFTDQVDKMNVDLKELKKQYNTKS
jgi:outer membrane protein assembly factor BamD